MAQPLDRTRLEIVRSLAPGHFGDRHLASIDGTMVMVEVSDASGAAGDWARRLWIRERRVSERIDHPAFRRVLDVFDDGRGRPVKVETHVSGTSLERLLERAAPVNTARLAAIFAPLAEALAAAHLAGLVYRRLDSRRMIVTEAGRDGLAVHLQDLALVQAPTDPSDAQGLRSPSTDVFGLGKLLWWGASGARLELDPRAAYGLSRAPVPPLADLAPGLDPRLCGLVGAMLDPTPEFRPSAAEIAGALLGLAGASRSEPVFEEEFDVQPSGGSSTAFLMEGPTPAFRTDRLALRMMAASEPAASGGGPETGVGMARVNLRTATELDAVRAEDHALTSPELGLVWEEDDATPDTTVEAGDVEWVDAAAPPAAPERGLAGSGVLRRKAKRAPTPTLEPGVTLAVDGREPQRDPRAQKLDAHVSALRETFHPNRRRELARAIAELAQETGHAALAASAAGLAALPRDSHAASDALVDAITVLHAA